MEYIVKSIRETTSLGSAKVVDGKIIKTGNVVVGIEGDTVGLQKSFSFTYNVDPATDTLNAIEAKLQAAGKAKFDEVTI